MIIEINDLNLKILLILNSLELKSKNSVDF